MTDKPQPLTFQPAPRPTARISNAVAEQLAGANADLGFSRASSAPSAPEAPAFKPAPRPAEAKRTAAAAPRGVRPARPVRVSRAETSPGLAAGLASLKFDVPEDLWTALKISAAQRRVTVKFLVLEALSKHGYEVDLDAIPEDGRRLR